jgi:hypothetical protein
LGFRKHIHRENIIDAAGMENLDSVGGKTALRGIGRALHIEHNGMRGDLLLDDFLCIHIDSFFSLKKQTVN